MQIPTSNISWVPDPFWMVYQKFAEHSAWYSGDPNQLLNMYNANVAPTANGRFWAEQRTSEMESVVHIPLASDIATFSADMLFSEEPDMRIVEADEKNASGEAKRAQERLEQIVNDGGLINKLLEAGETCAALGGCYLKPVWDSELADFPILTVAQPDNALPTFRFGMLQSVLFHKVIERDGNSVYRLLEYHEPGLIKNALFLGTETRIGSNVGLTYRQDTAEIPEEIQTGIDDILVRYVPNKMPNKLWRGSALGMSDFAGSESLLSALDATMSSWIRDIELGRSRIIVPETFLDKPDKDSDAYFNAGREIFTTLEMDPMNADKAPITLSQFNIRMDEHRKTALELIDRIISNAGYSPQSFGLSIEGRAESGTALNIRERKTFITKQKKERFFKPALESILHLMLQIDNVHLGNQTPTDFKPVVTFGDTLQHDINAIANTVNVLKQAESASIDTRVRMLNPDWNDEQVEQEVQMILKETGIAANDPMQIGGNTYDTE